MMSKLISLVREDMPDDLYIKYIDILLRVKYSILNKIEQEI